ncbi:RNA-binding S4 domain-containing protein [uncultured Paracoccus sp.]|uniref:RNA-binding S4 domain-containing protein n=1 Tax=uncultured Paracoccus sp. TaxID=189685 RepID=UPI002611E249|nr:RNA-binding S4 domain-containing protein [uncultured Paracoccus sp.]
MTGSRDTPSPDAGAEAIRLDRWLYHARVFKTRTLAVERICKGGVRLNGRPCQKPGQSVRPGDVVTAAVPGGVRVLRVRAPGERRGPAAEAQLLFDDLTAEAPTPGGALEPPSPKV